MESPDAQSGDHWNNQAQLLSYLPSDSQDLASPGILLHALITKQNRNGISLSSFLSHFSTCSYSSGRQFSFSRVLSIRSGFAGCPWEQCNPCPMVMDWIKPLIVKWKLHQTLYGVKGGGTVFCLKGLADFTTKQLAVRHGCWWNTLITVVKVLDTLVCCW